MIDQQESLSIQVGGFLLSKGFDLASCTGIAEHKLVQSDSLGILLKDPEAKPRKYLSGLITRETREPRRMFLGTVWFSNRVRGASEQNWVFEAHGRKHMALVRQLAEEMTSTFNVKIVLRLVREEADVETFRSELRF